MKMCSAVKVYIVHTLVEYFLTTKSPVAGAVWLRISLTADWRRVQYCLNVQLCDTLARGECHTVCVQLDNINRI